MDSRSNEAPKHSPGRFTHKVSTKRFGKTVITVNTICDAHDHILISEWFPSSWDCEDDQGADLAPGDWHLFAAAPEMLEALKLFYDWSKNVTKYPPYWLQTTFVDKCSEIIAKAEGRTP
jgi:hypothetical protein